jgi:phosphoribosylglycinamide formyltransferase-1
VQVLSSNNIEACCRVVVLISGNGSNLQAIIDHCNNGETPAEVVAVISNVQSAFGLKRARSAGIEAHCLNHREFMSRGAFDEALTTLIEGFRPDLVALAGFIRILSPSFVDHFAGRLMNIHPSLLPQYPGLDTHRRVIADGAKEHGATVHFVTRDLDAGPVIIQGRVEVGEDDSEHSLETRVHEVEHRIYPEAVRWFASGRLRLQDDVALLDGQPLT